MADIQVLRGPGVFACIGLGSCIGLCAADPVANVAGMAHIMLPHPFPDKRVDRPGKFAETAVPALIERLVALGADAGQILVAYAGGAQVVGFGQSAVSTLGERNADAVASLVRSVGMACVGVDVGGTQGRTITLCSATGEVRVRTASGERLLCTMRGAGGGR